ncbi:MAG: hypothetical protein ACTSQJ_00195 [Promethearchaeota archaeon]
MKRKCNICGMIRAVKDLVLLQDDTQLCFSCWNKKIKEKKNKKGKSS